MENEKLKIPETPEEYLNQELKKWNGGNNMDRLEQLKLNSIENPGKKKRGCGDCKKKKEITEPLPTVDYEAIWIPTKEDIKLAYAELTSFGGVKEDKKIFINKVYNFLFGEDFNFNCKGCGRGRVRKFTNYVNTLG